MITYLIEDNELELRIRLVIGVRLYLEYLKWLALGYTWSTSSVDIRTTFI